MVEMERKRYRYRFACAILLVLLAVAGFAFVWIKFVEANNNTGFLLGRGNIAMSLGIYTVLFAAVGQWLKAFQIGVERKFKNLASVVLAVLATDMIEIFVSMAVTGQFRYFPALLWRYILLALAQSVVLGMVVILAIDLYRRIMPPISMIEIKGDYQNDLAFNLSTIEYKYVMQSSIDYRVPFEELKKAIDDKDAVLINDIPTEVEKEIIKYCFQTNKRVYLLPKISDIILRKAEDLNVVDSPLFLYKNSGMRTWESVTKRFFDIVLASLALVLLSPTFLITALAIKLEDGGPVFFKQERVTIGDRHFMIIKFRSMIVDAEKDGRPHPAGEKDDRITKVGRIIRMCRVDELPQLINIIKGDMSIVGPRPERFEHCEKYSKEIPEFSLRHKVRGGLTGYAQVYGKYNTSALDKLKMDLVYITNYSLVLDVQIIFETVKILFMKDSTEGFDEKRIKEMHE